jgi:hypothetical protein
MGPASRTRRGRVRASISRRHVTCRIFPRNGDCAVQHAWHVCEGSRAMAVVPPPIRRSGGPPRARWRTLAMAAEMARAAGGPRGYPVPRRAGGIARAHRAGGGASRQHAGVRFRARDEGVAAGLCGAGGGTEPAISGGRRGAIRLAVRADRERRRRRDRGGHGDLRRHVPRSRRAWNSVTGRGPSVPPPRSGRSEPRPLLAGHD